MTAEERDLYREITISAIKGTKYDKLIRINTAQELILAEYSRSQRIPADDPQIIYLFSIGRGLAAHYNPAYVHVIAAPQEQGQQARDWIVSNSTTSELDTEFRNMEKPVSAEEEQVGVDRLLDQVAQETLS